MQEKRKERKSLSQLYKVMILQNLDIIGQGGAKHIKVIDDKIQMITYDSSLLASAKSERNILFENALAFPGLINSHDHLDFNLFPETANRIYKSYIEWGADIQSQNKTSIDAILAIPKQIRVEWGIYKNLLNGVTTVVNHGEYLDIKNPVINIFQDCYSLHSVRRERLWKFKLNRTFIKSQPFVIHVGEGTDKASSEEINELIRWNLFKRKLIAVHGVSMNAKQAEAFEALIWCPESNFFLLGSTAKINELKKQTKILFGTDSTLSAGWNLWEHLRRARKTNMLSDEELFDSLTSSPAATWKFKDSGILTEGKSADIVIARIKDNRNLLNSFFQLNPEDILLTLNKGEIILFDETLYSQLNEHVSTGDFSKIYIGKAGKYVKGNLSELIKKIKEFVPEIKLPAEIK
jgi:cytosine/adenosine deaminase-related metal-dependent hydrolase